MKSLQDKVSNLSGIGPKKELALKALGIETIEDFCVITHSDTRIWRQRSFRTC